MSRKTGALVLLALAAFVAFLGVMLALQSRGQAQQAKPPAPVQLETLTIESR
jgi:hypothetical protein